MSIRFGYANATFSIAKPSKPKKSRVLRSRGEFASLVPDDDQPHKTRRIWVKAGTQIIDRVWGELRKHLGTRKPVNTKMLTNKIRSFQWLHWHRGEDLWLATGEMLEEAFLMKHGQ